MNIINKMRLFYKRQRFVRGQWLRDNRREERAFESFFISGADSQSISERKPTEVYKFNKVLRNLNP